MGHGEEGGSILCQWGNDLTEVWDSWRGCVLRFIMEKVCMSLVGGRSCRSMGVYALDQGQVTDGCVCLK